ncbi:unnamed protein product [Ilex paraguariensis]|uniref:DUF1279 domain-containing protein n=1 Tax=Ilex paraguariensis TaxID=185542 RepID=A0ABC8SAJ8_9AQUA
MCVCVWKYTQIGTPTYTYNQKSMAFRGGRFRELLKKYGKVALGVHFSVSAASTAGLYVAIKNNVDVESMLEKIGMQRLSKTLSKEEQEEQRTPNLPQTNTGPTDGSIREEPVHNRDSTSGIMKKKNRTAEMATSSGGALAMAMLLNKALFPVRVPITIALTPPVARFLSRRGIMKNGV